MLDTVKNYRHEYHEKIMCNLHDFSYRHKRYNIEYALAFGLCSEENNCHDFADSRRKTDKFTQLSHIKPNSF